MITVIKCTCFLFMLVLLPIASIYGQNINTFTTYTRIVLIDKNQTLSASNKLKKLYQIKKAIEENKNTNDSAYIITLIKIAKYTYTQDINLSIQFSLHALQLNKFLHPSISKDVLVNACFNLASYYEYSLQQSKALILYDTVIFLCKQSDPQDYIISSRYRKANIYASLGDYQKVVEECTRGINESVKYKDSLHYIILLNLRAVGQLNQMNLFDALNDIEKAIPIEQATNNSYWLATSYGKKALIFQKQEKYKIAEEFFLKAIKIRPHIPMYYETIATDYNDLANLYLFNFNKIKEAKKNYFLSLSFGNKCDSITKGLISLMAFENLGEAYRQQHRFEESIKFFTIAANQFNLKTKDFLFTNLTINQLSVIEYRDLLFTLFFGKTALLLDLFKETNKPVYLQAYLLTAMLTDTLITRTRHESLSENTKLYWRNQTRNFFNNSIEASYLANDASSAFYFMEKSRAALLNDKWNELGAKVNLPEKETDRQEYLQTKIIEQREQLSSLQPSAKQYDSTENNLLQTVDSLEHFIKSLENNYPAYYQFKYADDVPSLQALQQYLAKNNQSFVYYFMNDTSMYALGITKNKTSFIKIAATDFNSHQLASFIQLCSDKKKMMNNYPAYASLSQTIYKKLFEPLQIPKGNVAICTDNFFIPFEALCTDDKGKNYLLYQYNFSYAYSARSLLKTFTYSKPTGNFIGFAPVSFSSSLGVFDLKQSATALQNVADFYSRNTLLTQQQATRKSFFEKASHYSVVTIFSHAQADTTDKEPVLYMQDSVIHLSDLQRLNNPAIQFVLLSACQTNIGKNATGEGIYSLARGFASAGIPSVSATLWKADEDAVYQISTKFNEFLSKGTNKSEALQNAKIWYLQNNENKENSLPYYWANLVLIGSSQPVVLASSNHTWIWMIWVIFLIILLSLIVYVFYKKKNNARIILDDVV